jgi:hypothetical protein
MTPEPIVAMLDQCDASAANVAADPSLREWSGARVRRRTVEEPVTSTGRDDDRLVLAAFAFQ